jgi:murein DD-endopeptidase MepM/ murein hydrolase activator NlpD
MTEVTDNQTTEGRKLPTERILLVLVVLLAVLAVSTPMVSSLWNTAKASFGDPYSLYRATVERRHLEEFNRRLTSELVALRSRNSNRSAAEQELDSRLNALEEAVEGATSLGFMKRGRNAQGQVVARASDKKKTGPLAALLEDPQLAKRSRGKTRQSSHDTGIGGAEVPCADDTCAEGATKRDISLVTSFAPSSDLNDVKSQQATDGLRDRFERAVDVLSFLPIGAPVDGEVSSEFGHRRSPFSRRASFHEGLDLRLRPGGRVLSTGAGTVTHVAYNSTYGVVVDIEHAPGLVSRYAHLAQALVRVGQVVSRGTQIAQSGSTGRSTGPHLHYEILYRERPKNPRPFIELADNLRELGFHNVG